MAGPWEKYQQQPAQAGPWQKYAQPAQPVKPQPAGEIRPMTFMEQLERNEPITSKMPLSQSIPAFVGDIGGMAIRTAHHPIDTLASAIKSVIPGTDTPNPLKSLYEGLNTKPAETIAQGIGQTAVLGGATEGAHALLPLVSPAVRSVGNGLQESGTGLINQTVGALKPDFRRGANPGKAYLDAGGGPALSMQSLADKGATLKSKVGANIGNAVDTATEKGKTISPQRVFAAMAPAIKNAVDLEMGPGGMKNTQPLLDYAKSFTPAFNDAYSNGGFTPSQLFDMKTRIAKGTNWSEPSQLNLRSVRQQDTGALSGLLQDEIPALKPLNSQYQGLTNFAKRAQARADTHSMPLTSIALKTGLSATGAGTGLLMGHPIVGALTGAAIDSVPFKTTLARGLYSGGKGLGALADGVPALPPPNLPAVAVAANGLQANAKRKDSKDGQ